MRCVFWGTFDLGKPRNRILLRGLQENGVDVIDCHAPVWSGIEDKSQIASWAQRLRVLLRWISRYPGLVARYLRLPEHDAVVVGYPGQLDVLVLWLFAKWRGVPIVLDAFMSLYNTVVEDRRLVGPRHPLAWALYGLEWLACRAADRVILDTDAHGQYFQTRFGLAAERMAAVLVGVEPEAFSPPVARRDDKPADAPLKVLFYGQCIPLQGVETIVRAAQSAHDLAVEWVLIGQGQEQAKIERLLDRQPVETLRWIPWVDYGELKGWIERADVCLGIFGETEKAGQVIPNKVFQALAAGAPVITRDSPAIRELLSEDMRGVYLVPPGDPRALIAAMRRFRGDRVALNGEILHRAVAKRITPHALGAQLASIVAETIARRSGAAPARRDIERDKRI